MTELEVMRRSHLIDPELHFWGWEIPVYLFLGGLVAGLMILSGLLAARGDSAERSKWSRWMPFAGPVLLSLGMLALFLDLEYKRHVYRFFMAFEWTSPMSWGSWILIAVYPAAILLGFAGLPQREVDALVRSWPVRALRLGGLARWLHRLAAGRGATLGRVNVGLGIALGGYTGILLGALGARAAWSSIVLGPLFLVSGLSTGAALMMLFPLDEKEHHFVRRWDVGAIGLELAFLALFFIGLITAASDEGRYAASLFFGGRFTVAFWALVVFGGLLVPLALETLETRRHLKPTLVAPALILVGGLTLRWVVVLAGQA
jgi:protein NrfD